jgi:hypothetical protein
MTLHDNTKTEGAASEVRQTKPGAISPSETAIAKYAGRDLQSNRGIPLNVDWVNAVRVNTSAVERRAQSLVTRRTVKKEWQAAWLLRAITCMDLTTLSGDDTDERVLRLCAKARQPLQQEIVQKLGVESLQIKVAAVCVYHSFVETARRGVEGSGIHVAAARRDSLPAFPRLPNESPRSGAPSRPAPMKSTWSSPALMCSVESGSRSTMRLPCSRMPAGRRI